MATSYIYISVLLVMLLFTRSVSKMLYVIGESHGALYDYNDNKYIQLPATTMHRIGISGLEGIVDTKIIDRGSHVLFVVGEIDIRCHIHKQVNQLKRHVDE